MEAKRDPGFENEILEIEYSQRETPRIKGFNGLTDLFSILKLSPSIDHGCYPSKKKKRKVEQKEEYLN
jgi:hypothetical protein